MTSYCSDSGASRQLLSNPCCGLALVYLREGTSGTQIHLFHYLFFCFKRIHAHPCGSSGNFIGPNNARLSPDLFIACTCCSCYSAVSSTFPALHSFHPFCLLFSSRVSVFFPSLSTPPCFLSFHVSSPFPLIFPLVDCPFLLFVLSISDMYLPCFSPPPHSFSFLFFILLLFCLLSLFSPSISHSLNNVCVKLSCVVLL